MLTSFSSSFGLVACDGARSRSGPTASTAPRARIERPAASRPAQAASTPTQPTYPLGGPAAEEPTSVAATKVEVKEQAMGTTLHFIAYASTERAKDATRAAFASAIGEMKRLESILSEWQDQSEVGQLNVRAGDWVAIGPETLEVLKRGLWAGKVSEGRFDITFQSLSAVWKFGTAQDAVPALPSKAEVEKLRRLVDYRRVELDEPRRRARIGKGQKLGLGGIAKGYILDRAVKVLLGSGVHDFLAQAGGDLYGSGKKPDGSPWVSGVQDPRGPQGEFFATIELTDHAFSTAGDYARSYVLGNKRYHHIIDPKTGFPATACRSVTIWAADATTADAVDDAVFILGPEKGLKLVESLDGVGAVIVDARNHVYISERLQGRVKVLKPPTDGI